MHRKAQHSMERYSTYSPPLRISFPACCFGPPAHFSPLLFPYSLFPVCFPFLSSQTAFPLVLLFSGVPLISSLPFPFLLSFLIYCLPGAVRGTGAEAVTEVAAVLVIQRHTHSASNPAITPTQHLNDVGVQHGAYKL